jgi:hypothetical protein
MGGEVWKREVAFQAKFERLRVAPRSRTTADPKGAESNPDGQAFVMFTQKLTQTNDPYL